MERNGHGYPLCRENGVGSASTYRITRSADQKSVPQTASIFSA